MRIQSLQTENTNFALLVAKHFSEPFKDSNGYGESIARLSNMLGGGVIVQRFGDLVRGRRSTVKRIEEGLVTPTLAATPGDLSLVLPKRILDGIIEMIYALDKIAPGTANDDTLLYGVEVKFYNMEVALDEHLETPYKGLYRHRRRQRHYAFAVARIGERCLCRARDSGNGLTKPFANCSAQARGDFLRRAGVRKRGILSFSKESIPLCNPREKGRGAFPLDPAHCEFAA